MGLDPVIGIEIGTTKTVALVGELRDDGHIVITGRGETASLGVRKGEICDLKNAENCVRTVIAMAEQSGKVMIGQVMLALSGGHVQGVVNSGTVPVMDPAAGVSDEDMEQVLEVAKTVNLPADRHVMHTINQHYRVDNQDRVLRPDGMEGARLSLDVLVMHGVRTRMNNTMKAVQELGIEVQDVVFSGFCSAMSVLSPQQKQGGAIVIDLGGGKTDYVMFADGIAADAGSLGVGGDHVTNDLVKAFSISVSQADALKRSTGCVMGRDQAAARIEIPVEMGSPERSLPLKSVNTVITLRVEETLEMVKRKLDPQFLQGVASGVVLTGGGALMPGITDAAERVFGLPCGIGRPRNVSGLAAVTESPAYATVAGLVQYGFRTASPGSGGKLTDWFRRKFIGRGGKAE